MILIIIGGLLIDLHVLNLKASDKARGEEIFKKNFESDLIFPAFESNDPVIIEWRALTVSLLDLIAEDIRKKLGLDAKKLPLAKVLEAGTWKVLILFYF